MGREAVSSKSRVEPDYRGFIMFDISAFYFSGERILRGTILIRNK